MEIDPTQQQYEIPSYLQALADGMDKATPIMLQRLREIRDIGQTLIEQQDAYQELPNYYEYLDSSRRTSYAGYSDLEINKLQRNFRELYTTISNLKPAGQAVTKNRKAEGAVDRMNKMKQLWWIITKQDRVYRKACQYAVGCGTVYIEPWWDNNFYGYDDGEIACKVHGPTSVLPCGLPEDHDLQKAYAVTVHEEIPLHLILEQYPAARDAVQSARNVPGGWVSRLWKRVEQIGGRGNGVLGVLATPMKDVGRSMAMVDVYTSYIRDGSVNNTGAMLSMGEPGTSWYYKVPYIGQQIPTGLRDEKGKPIYRIAMDSDCRLFPLRRRVIWTDTCILKDGTSPYLHGRVPLVQMRFDDRPWDFLGHSIVKHTWRIQKAIGQIVRATMDSVLVRLQPPLKHDPNVIDKNAMARINTRKPAQTVEIAPGIGEAIASLLPVAHWDVPAWIMNFVGLLFDNLDKLTFVNEVTAIAKAKQVPSADSIEKLLEMAGPVVQDMARGGEVVTQELDQLIYPMMMQFWGTDKVFHLLGDDGDVKEMLDFRPGELIPSHLPNEDPRNGESVYSRWERMRWANRQLSYVIEPYSQAQVSRIGRNLVLMQAKKAGVTVSDHTIGKGLGLNVGELPPMRNGKPPVSEWEKVEVEMELRQALAEDLQGGQQPGQQGPGRPNSNRKSPSLRQKDQGTRSTVTTS